MSEEAAALQSTLPASRVHPPNRLPTPSAFTLPSQGSRAGIKRLDDAASRFHDKVPVRGAARHGGYFAIGTLQSLARANPAGVRADWGWKADALELTHGLTLTSIDLGVNEARSGLNRAKPASRNRSGSAAPTIGRTQPPASAPPPQKKRQ